METSRTETATATATTVKTNVKIKTKSKSKRQPRSRPLPPDVTSRNLAIEKRRREDMNRIFSVLYFSASPVVASSGRVPVDTDFQDLTQCLPRLASAKRLSKRLIVIESLQHLRQQRGMCIAAARDLRELLSAHNDLIAEANMLRSQLGMSVRNAPRPPSTAFLSLMHVEEQTYAGFPDDFASPGVSEDYEPQPSSRQSEAYTALPVPPAIPDFVHSSQHPTQAHLLNCLDETRNLAPSEGWQTQTSGNFYPSLDSQDALVSEMDWWGLDISEPNTEFPWEDLATHVLP